MSRSLPFRWAAAALIVLASAGCGGASKPPSASGAMHLPASVTPSPLTGDVPAVTLPIQAYKPTSAQLHQIQTARLTAMRACMGRLGFDFPPLSSFPKDTSGTALSSDAFRYGPLSVREAAEGYRFAVLADARNTAGQPSQPVPTQAESAALDGDSRHPGCAKQANAAVAGDSGTFASSDLVSDIDAASYDKSQSAPPVVAAMKAWSACMAGKGFTYATSKDAIADPKFQGGGDSTGSAGGGTIPAPSAAEIATAQADVACKQSTDLAGIWVATETALQNQAIEANAQALKHVQDQQAAMLRNVAKILGG